MYVILGKGKRGKDCPVMIDNYYNYLEQLRIMIPRFLCVFFFDSKMEKGILRQFAYLQSQWMDFKNLNGVWKLKRFCINCIELIFKFLSQ